MATVLKFKHIAKDRLFYGLWQYCITFSLDEASAVKVLDHTRIDSAIEHRKMWLEMASQRWYPAATVKLNSNHILSKSQTTKKITDDTIKNLHDFTDMLLACSAPFKLVTSVNRGWVYTNSLSLIEDLSKVKFLTNQEYTEAVIVRPENTVILVNPKHTRRSYFKSVKISKHDKDNLVAFFVNYSDQIRVSPAFKGWLSTPYIRSQDYFFIDHNGDSWLVLLSLVCPGLIRKTVDIVSA